MKFSTKFLTVLAASTVLAAALPEEENNQTPPEISFPVMIDKECGDYIMKHEDCTPQGVYANAKHYEDICVNFETEKCQKFIKTSLVDVPECKNLDKIRDKPYIDFYDIFFKANYVNAKFHCGKDEKGNYCPLSAIGLEKNYNFNVITNETLPDAQKNEIYDKAIKDTCNSQKCAEDFLDVIEEVKNDHKQFFDELSKNKDLTDAERRGFEYIFNGDEQNETKDLPIDKFQAQCDVKKAKAESGATPVTFSSALFVTLALLLYSLL